jgi:hypothetical protein
MIDQVSLMTNEELIGLAKNRFLPVDLQMAIAKHPYDRANLYLACNSGLKPSTRDYLWSDSCSRGYVIKSDLISGGHYREEPEKYWELYNRYPVLWWKSRWRALSAFLGTYNYRNSGWTSTPGDLLEEIYSHHLNPKTYKVEAWNQYASVSSLKSLAEHPNCSLKLAIQLSTCGMPKVEQSAFKKIVELS